MTEQPGNKASLQPGISEWLNSTGDLAKLVAEEQRPQLITLVLIYIAFLILILFSSMSDGIKVLMFVLTSVGLLWLAFFILPKQARGVQNLQLRVNEKEAENEVLKSEKSDLEKEKLESTRILSDKISQAHSCLETIENRTLNIKEQVLDEEIKGQLLDLQHYISVKKREFDSAVARVTSGGKMIAKKKPAAASMAVGFFEDTEDNLEESEHKISQDTSV